MNTVVVPWFHGVAVAAMVWWFLLRLSVWQRGLRVDLRVTWVAAAAAVVMCIAPVGGVPWMRWVFGIWTNPSLPLLGWVAAGIVQHGFGRPLFSFADRRALAVFGAVAGTILYLHAMIPGVPDLYAWGWEPKVALGVTAVLAVIFLGGGSRIGILFLLALVAHAAGALESTNAWDYVVDPVYWLVSLGVLVKQAVPRSAAPRPSSP